VYNLLFLWKNKTKKGVMMKENKVSKLFERFLAQDTIFKDKRALQVQYTPENIPHRDEQIEQIAKIMAPCLRMEKPSNLFLYGKTGTGKTLAVTHTTNNIAKIAKKREIPLAVLYLNCKLKKIADTEYRIIAQITRELGREIPPTGLPTDEVYRVFFNLLEERKQLLILVLDEIDQLVKKIGDEILYNLTRINTELKNSQVSIIGISNDLSFTNNLDPRVKSSLSEEEIVFPPYNALQLQDILKERIGLAFIEGVLEEGVVEKCAAYAAREHGDARRALELMRVAGEIAQREEEKKIRIFHIDKAEEKIEKEKMLDIILYQPKQFQAALYSIITLHQNKRSDKLISTGEIYELYKNICGKINLRMLTQRRVSDIIQELDMLGIINAQVISKGRYGRTREISLSLQDNLIPKVIEILKKDLDI